MLAVTLGWRPTRDGIMLIAFGRGVFFLQHRSVRRIGMRYSTASAVLERAGTDMPTKKPLPPGAEEIIDGISQVVRSIVEPKFNALDEGLRAQFNKIDERFNTVETTLQLILKRLPPGP